MNEVRIALGTPYYQFCLKNGIDPKARLLERQRINAELGRMLSPFAKTPPIHFRGKVTYRTTYWAGKNKEVRGLSFEIAELKRQLKAKVKRRLAIIANLVIKEKRKDPEYAKRFWATRGAYHKRRMATDPVYRQGMKDAHVKWRDNCLKDPEYVDVFRDKESERSRRWYALNADKKRAYAKEYHLKNPRRASKNKPRRRVPEAPRNPFKGGAVEARYAEPRLEALSVSM